jgi:hypothetical protein
VSATRNFRQLFQERLDFNRRNLLAIVVLFWGFFMKIRSKNATVTVTRNELLERCVFNLANFETKKESTRVRDGFLRLDQKDNWTWCDGADTS